MYCTECGSENPDANQFCGTCGTPLAPATPHGDLHAPAREMSRDAARKQVTVLFSDLSGYTAISEKLDPEEVREIMTKIFGETARVVAKYEGHIEKFVGDGVMILFGVPAVREDDPVRAIKASMEIHELVEKMSPRLESRIGRGLRMHTGITTGLVLTGDIETENGIGGALGDSVNLASRLSSLAGPGEIVVGEGTFSQAERYIDFEALEPVNVKGKAEPVTAYRVLGLRAHPDTVHRLSGLSARLIGRKTELARLRGAAARLRGGAGCIISISGDAGTGKSRLVREFHSALDLEEVQWVEAHCYAHAQSIPYFPLIDLLGRAWQIQEGDPPQDVREKVESNIHSLLGSGEDVIPYIGSLFGLSYPEVEGIDPEFWRAHLFEAVKTVLGALTHAGPTVIWLEDLHWADRSSLELLRTLLIESRYPGLFLCVYRPPFSIFAAHQMAAVGTSYQEIRLADLSLSEAQDMMESLLDSQDIPLELRSFVEEKLEGNPFYLEEVVNSLVESDTLGRTNGGWHLARPLSDVGIPLTINGVISARLDRLERGMKRVLQEASVIGRAFLHSIIQRTTEHKDDLDECLSGLERLDLIRMRSLEPELEYIFKHALTQDVVYNGLLKKERQEIHERIAVVMEEIFADRLTEFCETLAFHFKRGKSVDKAVVYLAQSGKKSLARYAVEESHEYYQEAFTLLSEQAHEGQKEIDALLDLLDAWSLVFFYRGDFRGLEEVLLAHEDLATSTDDKAGSGMFYAWMGMALWGREKLKDARRHLLRALELGEEAGSARVIGYANAWLGWVCTELGLLDDAIAHGEKARVAAASLESDHDLYVISLGGLGYVRWMAGDRAITAEIGAELLEFGQRKSNTRALVYGYFVLGHSHFIDGDLVSAAECYEAGRRVSADPWLSQFPRLLLSLCYAYDDRFDEAAGPLREICDFSDRYGSEIMGSAAGGLLAATIIAQGEMGRGAAMLEEAARSWRERGHVWRLINTRLILGNVYLRIVQRSTPIAAATLLKNLGFVVRNVPFAARTAETYLTEAVQAAEGMGAKCMHGLACLDLGALYQARKKPEQARACFADAAASFERCGAQLNLEKARQARASVE